ncbi:hypothetical protein D3C84_1150300 [compost metagenome]
MQGRQQHEGAQGHQPGDRQQALGRQAPAHALANQQVAEETAADRTDRAAEKDDEGGRAYALDVEATGLGQVARAPGQQAEEHHGPAGTSQ